MSGKGNAPVGYAVALIKGVSGEPDIWAQLGPVWQTQGGNYMVSVESIPIAWTTDICRERGRLQVLIKLNANKGKGKPPMKPLGPPEGHSSADYDVHGPDDDDIPF